ncbi:MAG: T9SS type A sorting domain-containing protein [bacterium]|nr:T9SS type A sorting domain-containing protein [bacterium]
MTRRIVCVTLSLLLIQNAYATIRRVPTEFSSIQSALSVVQSNDTILLAPGHYIESISRDPFPTPLTISSNYLFTNDSSDIASTRWSPDSLRCFQDIITNCKLTISGVAFTAPISPVVGSGVFYGISDSVFFNNCHIQGIFDDQWGVSEGLIYIWNTPSYLEVNDCRFFGDSVGTRNVISVSNVPSKITRTIVRDRTDWRETAFDLIGDASIIQCQFFGNAPQINMRGNSLIDSCKFIGVGHWAIHISCSRGSPQDYQIIRDCTFMDVVSTRFYPVIGVRSDTTRSGSTLFQRVEFLGGDGSNETCRSIIESDHRVNLENCRFENITGFQCIASVYRVYVDSSDFVGNSSPIFARIDGFHRDSAYIHNSNFSDNTRIFTTIATFAVFDSVYAQNCWWGDSTGPRHVLNPNGLGDSLPAYVNPFPFRTTPVFPETGVREPISNTYSLPNSIVLRAPFPNPFNNATMIRFSLPHPTDATIAVHDLTGREVATLARGWLPTGNNFLIWNPNQLSSGSYFIRLSSPQGQVTRTISYLK